MEHSLFSFFAASLPLPRMLTKHRETNSSLRCRGLRLRRGGLSLRLCRLLLSSRNGSRGSRSSGLSCRGYRSSRCLESSGSGTLRSCAQRSRALRNRTGCAALLAGCLCRCLCTLSLIALATLILTGTFAPRRSCCLCLCLCLFVSRCLVSILRSGREAAKHENKECSNHQDTGYDTTDNPDQ